MIKATVTRSLPGLPSLQSLHHVLSGTESILARLMRLSSKVDTLASEEAGEADAHSDGQAVDAANAQVSRDAPQQQAQQPAIPPQAHHAVPAGEWQTAVPAEEWQPAVSAVPQHVSYYGPRQPPAYVPAAAVPAPVVQQVPVMAPAPMPVITARVTNVQVWLNPWSRVGDIR